jgi:MFS transporter, PAT family, beta-lactamase induction signal transducer AmpG
MLCAAIGLIAVAFVILEWIRTAWAERRGAADGPVLQADAAKAPEGDTA